MMACRHNSAIEEKVRVMQERDAARDEVAALQTRREASSRQQITVSQITAIQITVMRWLLCWPRGAPAHVISSK